MATLTNYHLVTYTTTDLLSCSNGGQKSHWAKTANRAMWLLEALGKESVSSPLLASVEHNPWLVHASLNCHVPISLCVLISGSFSPPFL